MMDLKRLTKEIAESGITKKHISDRLEITVTSLESKLQGKTQFKANECYEMKQILHLSDFDFIEIFFKAECDNLSQKRMEA